MVKAVFARAIGNVLVPVDDAAIKLVSGLKTGQGVEDILEALIEKVPGLVTPPLAHYLGIAQRVMARGSLHAAF